MLIVAGALLTRGLLAARGTQLGFDPEALLEDHVRDCTARFFRRTDGRTS